MEIVLQQRQESQFRIKTKQAKAVTHTNPKASMPSLSTLLPHSWVPGYFIRPSCPPPTGNKQKVCSLFTFFFLLLVNP